MANFTPCSCAKKDNDVLDKDYFIEGYCHIKNNTVLLNGESLFVQKNSGFAGFMKSAYQHFEVDYPKFFKMDKLSKLAFMGAEVLLKKGLRPLAEEENMAVVLSNRASSLDTDRRYQESIKDPDNFYPSPAVFVYTLPNICIGEISIRHKLYSENSFFIFDKFNADHLWHYSKSLLHHNKADSVLCGWVDVNDNDYEAFLYTVSPKGGHAHKIEEITRLYFTK